MTTLQLNQFVSQKGEREFDPKQTLQIIKISSRWRYVTWGVSKLLNMFDKGLCLKVSGNKHKGWVIITLSYLDTYSVFIVSNSGVVKDEYHEVYFDQLFEVIDDRIEKIPEYRR